MLQFDFWSYVFLALVLGCAFTLAFLHLRNKDRK